MNDRITMEYEGEGMKLVVDLPDDLVGRIKDIVEEEGYDDAREFVETAIENQLELEEGGGSESYKTLDEAISELESDQSTAQSTQRQTQRDVDATTSESESSYDIGRREYRAVVPLAPPSPDRVDDGPLWGQYNRLLPVKFVVRRLANELEDHGSATADEPTTIAHDSFSSTVAKEARAFGQQLKDVDEQKSRSRGEKLAAGFPTGDKVEKSIDRFESHFVGYSDRNGHLTGAPGTLKFVDITSDEQSQIGITEAGAEFAALENPILDDTVEADDPLSRSEREFYVEYVAEELPAELDGMTHTARAIQEGDDRPTSLTERVAELNDDWSDAMASTNRSGFVSRMHELGFVDRFRVGQRGVGYELTAAGEEFLQQYS